MHEFILLTTEEMLNVDAGGPIRTFGNFVIACLCAIAAYFGG